MIDRDQPDISDEKLQEKLAYWVKYLDPGRRDRPLETEEILKNVFEHIDVSQVRAVLLRGSRATGRQNPFSDVDLMILMKKELRTAEVHRDPEGLRYHFQIFGENDISDKAIKNICRFYYGTKPIYDPEGAGRLLTDRLNAAERKACEQIPKGNPECRNYLLKLTELLDLADPDTALYTRAKILCEFPAYLSACNGFNLTGYKHTIDCLIRDNCDLAMLYAEALKPGSGRTEIERLTDRAFREPCELDVLNTDFTHSDKAFDIRLGDSNMYLLYRCCESFMELVRLLKPYGMEAYDFFMACRRSRPGFFRDLISLLEPS